MSIAGSKPVDAVDVVADTWERLEQTLRALGKQICVRTQVPKKISDGGIHLAGLSGSFYAGLPNVDLPHKGEAAMVVGTICSMGEGVRDLKVGQMIYFPRGHFARYKQLSDESMVGWIKEEHVWATFEEE